MNYGYIRVSAKDQNEARQLAALSGLTIPSGNLYLDKQSGKSVDRPSYRRLRRRLRTGDVLYRMAIRMSVSILRSVLRKTEKSRYHGSRDAGTFFVLWSRCAQCL